VEGRTLHRRGIAPTGIRAGLDGEPSRRDHPTLARVERVGGEVEYRILGALEVVSNGTRVQLGPPKQRAVLAVLLLHAGEVVSTDHLIEQVWGDHPPRTAAHSVQLYISDLRRSLERVGHETSIETRAPGYLLRVETGYIDLRRFERLVAEGGRAKTGGDAAEGASRFEEALRLWRGPPLAEFAYEEFAQPEIRRLEELRLHAIEELAAADLELGRTQDAIAVLEGALAGDPLRERARELQMLALYRAGRHAEALRAYQRFAALLAEEMGLDPSPALRRLQERILLHDPTLVPAAISSVQAQNPYKGLSAFDEEDADDFFGRGELVGRLVATLAEGARLVAVVGPSGCGKSSVVNAGLIPTIRSGTVPGSERWAIAGMMPGRRPLEEIGVALTGAGVGAAREDPLAALAEAARIGYGSGEDLLLVIDQFEEVFSAAGEVDRDRFLEALSALGEAGDGHVRVVLTLRGDFYDRPLLHPRFSRVFVPSVVNVLPMAPDEIEAAILGPAGRVDVAVEPSLRATLVADAAGEPGALPFLQFALTELFERRNDGGLTLDAYRDLGGLHGVVSRRAERVYGHLDEEARDVALQVFLRLVRVGGGARHSRRRARLAELTDIGADPVALSKVLDAFGRHRLLSFDRDPATGDATVEVAHEALLWGWERLAGWVERHRADVRRRATLAAAAEEWRASGGHGDYLLTGNRLAGYEEWAEGAALQLASTEREFLDASVRRRNEHEAEESARLAAHGRLERRARRRLWAAAAALALLVAGGTFGLLSWFGSRSADAALIFTGYGDGGWTDMIAAGFDRAVSESGHTAERVISRTPGAYGSELRRLSAEGVGLIVSADAGLYQDEFEAIAADHPDTRYLALDIPTGKLSNVAYLNFRAEEGSYLAGAAAALKSQTGIVGFIGGADIPVIWPFEAGFEAGARAVRPDIEVRIVYLSQDARGFLDPDRARQVATRMYRNGADVIYHAAGGSGWGLFQAAYQVSSELGRHLWAIGVDADQYEEIRYAIGEDLALAWRGHILTSMMKRADLAIDTVMTEQARGEWAGGVRWFGLAEGGVGLSSSGGFIDDIRPDLDRLRDQIISGEIEVPVVPTRLGG
jgi:basic membrane lipoprotein Med (substrate-binding protein (PBP1-ABC) superfamily)/DNA-binding SARP family transcriptional activator